MILEASFTRLYDVYSTGVTYDECQSAIIICLQATGSLWPYLQTFDLAERARHGKTI